MKETQQKSYVRVFSTNQTVQSNDSSQSKVCTAAPTLDFVRVSSPLDMVSRRGYLMYSDAQYRTEKRA